MTTDINIIYPYLSGTESTNIIFPVVPGAPGDQGPPGPMGTPGSKWYNGMGLPSNSLGSDGDYYLNDTNGNVYQKAGGSWL